MVVKSATLTQEIFFPLFACFEKGSIPNFFIHKVLLFGASFEEKMKKFEDDIL